MKIEVNATEKLLIQTALRRAAGAPIPLAAEPGGPVWNILHDEQKQMDALWRRISAVPWEDSGC